MQLFGKRKDGGREFYSPARQDDDIIVDGGPIIGRRSW
jgi:hypothetical protein